MKQMDGKTDLNSLATETKGSVQNAQDMPFNSFSIPGGYNEPEVIGRVFGMKPSSTSAPLKGDMGVYVVNLATLTPAPQMTDAETEKKQLVDRKRNSAEGQLFNALRNAADVKDERYKFY